MGHQHIIQLRQSWQHTAEAEHASDKKGGNLARKRLANRSGCHLRHRQTSISVCCYLPIWGKSAWQNERCNPFFFLFPCPGCMALNQGASVDGFLFVESCYAFGIPSFFCESLSSASGAFHFWNRPTLNIFHAICIWPNSLGHIPLKPFPAGPTT